MAVPKRLPAPTPSGAWVIHRAWHIACATTVTGKGISLAGGFIQAAIKPGANGVTGPA